MKREMKIVTLWLMTICGLCCHTLTDLLPIFWGKNLAVMATDGNVQWGMIVMMMTITFVIPVIGLFCLMSDCKTKLAKMDKCCTCSIDGTIQRGSCLHGTAF